MKDGVEVQVEEMDKPSTKSLGTHMEEDLWGIEGVIGKDT